MLALLLVGCSGLLEGSALLALIPVLSLGVGGPVDGGAGYAGSLARWFEIPESGLILFALGLFTLLGIGAALSRFGADAQLLRLRIGIEETFRERMSRALLDMDWTHFVSLRFGDISTSILVEGQQIGVGAHNFLQGLGAAVAALAYLCIAFVVSVEMTLYTVGFGIGGAGLYLWGNRYARRHADRLSGVLGSIGNRVSDIFGNLKFFRATGAAESAGRSAARIYREYAQTLFWTQIYSSIMRCGFDVGAIAFISVFLLITLYVSEGFVATTLVFLAVFYRLTPRLLAIQDSLFQARIHLSWYKTWETRLDLAVSYRATRSGKSEPTFRKRIELDKVSFTYPGGTQPVLRDVSLTVSTGQCVAIVGASGGGKTTLLDLITGLLLPTAGRISVDGKQLPDLDVDAWQSRIGLVMQESPLFHASILENIAWGDASPDRTKATDCAQMAHAWEFIERLPQELDTTVGEKGARFSGGQRQRIAIARALYRDPWLLILDEATSALDGEAEAVVQQALEEIKGQCTIVMVAHRLRSVRMADEIVVLEHGSVVERGRWAALTSNSAGTFHRMAVLQGLAHEYARTETA